MEECLRYMNGLELEIRILNNLILKSDEEKIKQMLKGEATRKREILNKYRNTLDEIKDDEICCRLFAKLLKGKKSTKAVEEVANENFLNNIKPNNVSTIWKYYNKIKNIVE